MAYINENERGLFLVTDDGQESKDAIKELKEANIKFTPWALKHGRPPYIIRGRLRFLGLNQIRQFIKFYPDLLHAEAVFRE